jgi:hypothetical protein
LNRWRDRKVHIGYPAWDHLVWIPLPLGATALPELRDGKFFGHKFDSVHNLLKPLCRACPQGACAEQISSSMSLARLL